MLALIIARSLLLVQVPKPAAQQLEVVALRHTYGLSVREPSGSKR
jgi:hypothetical protein